MTDHWQPEDQLAGFLYWMAIQEISDELQEQPITKLLTAEGVEL